MEFEHFSDWLDYVKTKKPDFLEVHDVIWADGLEGIAEAMSNADDMPDEKELRSIVWLGAIFYCKGYTEGKKNGNN